MIKFKKKTLQYYKSSTITFHDLKRIPSKKAWKSAQSSLSSTDSVVVNTKYS